MAFPTELIHYQLSSINLDSQAIFNNEQAVIGVSPFNSLDLFENNKVFRAGCLSTSEWVLSNKSSNMLKKESIYLAVQYFLDELPLFLNTSKIFDTTSSVFIYKNMPDFLKTIYQGEFLVVPNQNFLVVNY